MPKTATLIILSHQLPNSVIRVLRWPTPSAISLVVKSVKEFLKEAQSSPRCFLPFLRQDVDFKALSPSVLFTLDLHPKAPWFVLGKLRPYTLWFPWLFWVRPRSPHYLKTPLYFSSSNNPSSRLTQASSPLCGVLWSTNWHQHLPSLCALGPNLFIFLAHCMFL